MGCCNSTNTTDIDYVKVAEATKKFETQLVEEEATVDEQTELQQGETTEGGIAKKNKKFKEQNGTPYQPSTTDRPYVIDNSQRWKEDAIAPPLRFNDRHSVIDGHRLKEYVIAPPLPFNNDHPNVIDAKRWKEDAVIAPPPLPFNDRPNVVIDSKQQRWKVDVADVVAPPLPFNDRPSVVNDAPLRLKEVVFVPPLPLNNNRNPVVVNDAQRLKEAVIAPPLLLKDDYQAPVFDKTREEQEFIIHALKKNFVFSSLTSRETDILVNAFERQEVKANAFLIRQGDAADFFYVIFRGACHIIVNNVRTGKALPGQTFGELALLYNSPRAASIQAESNCIVFRLDQSTFRLVLHDETGKAEKYKRDLISGVPFLKELDQEDINKLVATLRPHRFMQDQYLVKKGEEGDAFYIIQEGRVKTCDISVGAAVYSDETLGPGDYFGERALFTRQPRAANCIALTDGIALVIDKTTFNNVLGTYNRLIIKSQDKERLAGIQLFVDSQLDNTELVSLARLIVDKRYTTHDAIVVEGVITEAAVYLVRQGSVKIVSRRGTKIVEAGGYFGEEMLKADFGKNYGMISNSDPPLQRPQYTARALEDVNIGFLTLLDCRQIVDTTQLGHGKRKEFNSILGNEVKLEDLKRHRILGAGAFGQVWLVSRKTSRGHKFPYALKIQSKYELVENQVAHGVIQEKNIMAKLQHPFIINLVNAYQDERFVYMLLGFVQGGELYSIMHRPGSDGVPESSAKFYAACIFEALCYMHRRKILYRDLKPENVLLSNEGYPVLVDLGFAKVVTGKTFTLCGTPLYLAPEVILNRGHDKGADHWSFGVLVYEMITGYTPFEKDGIDQIKLFKLICKGDLTFPNMPLASGAWMSIEAEDLVKKLLVKSPAQRLGSLADGEVGVYNHSWFHGISFSQLIKRDIKAPWTPDVKDLLDDSNFHSWDDELEDKTTRVYPQLSKQDQEIFKSFLDDK